jgi:VIT1/CCC1 family predicted Fe2+/Mn2+ transporter
MNILDAILEVFTGVGTWISGAVTQLLPMFYVAETGLTLLGVLAVAGLAFSVVFLVIGIIQNFLHFRG